MARPISVSRIEEITFRFIADGGRIYTVQFRLQDVVWFTSIIDHSLSTTIPLEQVSALSLTPTIAYAREILRIHFNTEEVLNG